MLYIFLLLTHWFLCTPCFYLKTHFCIYFTTILVAFFDHNSIKLQVHTNYNLQEMKTAKTRLNRTQNLLKVTCHLK